MSSNKKAKPNKLIEVFGWLSVVFILAAYGLVTFNVVEVKSLTYQLLNLVGALGIIMSSLDNKNWQPIVLNIIWASIAIFGIIKSIMV